MSAADQPDIKTGQLWGDGLGPVRVMAVVEGYIMYRRPHAHPNVLSAHKFRYDFTYTPQPSTTPGRPGP